MTDRSAWWFLAPYLGGAAVLVLLPLLLTSGYAFTDHTGLGEPRFNGLDNARRLGDDPLVLTSLRASLLYVAAAVPLRLLIATALGLLLAAPRRAGGLYRGAVYLPTVVPDVALALLFLWVLNPVYGPVNQLLGLLGLPEPVWLASTWGARSAIVLMMLFPIGEAFVVVIAARRSIDPRLYEAAALEGASAWQQLCRLTLPLIAPVLVLLCVRDTVMALQGSFVPAYVLTDGGPTNATLFLPLYIYDQAFEFLGFGYAAFLTLILIAITAVLIGVQLLLVRRWRVLR